MGRVTGQREVRPIWNNAQRVNHQNKLTHPHLKRKFGPTVVATKSRLVPVNAAKQSSPRAAALISTARHVNTAASKPRVNAASPIKYSYFKAHLPLRRLEVVVRTVGGKRGNAVKSSACWIWRPTGKVIDHISKDSGSYMPKKFDYVDPQGRLKGFVAFAGSPKGGKITNKGKIRTGKLDFEDVYFVKELKFNLLSISQMCDKKNSVLFTETECLILSPAFKLLDESQVLLKVPRQDNMYSFNLKNVVPLGYLTYLIAMDTLDESNLWHMRLGYINFKKGKATQSLFVARTPQQNGVAKRKNRTLIEAARTMLVDSLLPTTFWAEEVNTACYVQNRVLVTKPHNKTPYELLLGRPPSINFMRPFGCPVTILNTLDSLGKFDGKADEGFLVGYSINSKAFRVFNTRTRKVEENLHINFLENKPNVAGSGQARKEKASDHEYILLPLMLSNSPLSSSTQSIDDKDADKVPNKGDDDVSQRNGQEKEGGASNKEADQHVQDFRAELDNFENINTGNPNINTASPIPNDSSMQSLENTGIFDGAYDDEDVGVEADLNNLETTMNVSPIPTTRIHKDHPKD
ncbi:ribonuclease H-like domain-containing protein [Tanacetum coccineum]